MFKIASACSKSSLYVPNQACMFKIKPVFKIKFVCSKSSVCVQNQVCVCPSVGPLNVYLFFYAYSCMSTLPGMTELQFGLVEPWNCVYVFVKMSDIACMPTLHEWHCMYAYVTWVDWAAALTGDTLKFLWWKPVCIHVFILCYAQRHMYICIPRHMHIHIHTLE